VRFLEPKEDDPRASQPGDLECRYILRCDISVVLILTEVGFWTEQWLDVSGSKTGEGSKLWLVFVRKDERLTGFEEDPSGGRGTEGCVDEGPGCPEPGESVEGRTSEEVC